MEYKMKKDIDSKLTRLEYVVDSADYDGIIDAIIDLSLSEEMSEVYPHKIFNHILAQLDKFKGVQGKGGNIIANAILSAVSKLDDSQWEKLRMYISNNYGDFTDTSISFSIAEWFGGCRDEWALNAIDKWLTQSTHGVPLNNLKVALYEFLDSDLPYAATLELQARARELQIKLNALLENVDKGSAG